MTDIIKEIPDISIIVPIYNVEEYLEECLDSIINQSKDNLEVIMVDDGSTDSSGEIAKEYEKSYPNFHYYYKENNGLGCARNYGVQFAKGKYIAFLDSDDIVTSGAYEKMFTLAEKNSSELTICNVARFNSEKAWGSDLHKRIFNGIDSCTHITKNHNLIFDTTSWNKLILRSFYLEKGFEFPENILYEDIPVTIPMHYSANNVSVVTDVGYLWRVRDGASKSITQNTSSMENLTDRIKVIRMVDEFFNKNITDKTQFDVKNLKTLEIDLMIFINVCNAVPAEQADEIMNIINDYIDSSVNKAVFPQMTIINQQKYKYVREHNLAALTELLEFQRPNYYDAQIEEKDGKFYIDLPDDLFTIESRDITGELVEFAPRKYINNIIIGKTGFEIYGHIYKRRVSIKQGEQKIRAFLFNEMTGTLTPLKSELVDNSELTSKMGQIFDAYNGKVTNYNYDGSGFKITVDLNDIKIDEANEGTNKILIEYENKLMSGKLFLGGANGQIKKKANKNTVLLGDSTAQLSFGYLDELFVIIKNQDNFAENITCEGERIVCTLEKPALEVWAQADDETDAPVPFDFENGRDFHINTAKLDFEKLYQLYVKKEDESIDNLLRRNTKITALNTNDSAFIIRSNRTYGIKLIRLQATSFIEKISEKNNVIKLKTISAGNNAEILSCKSAAVCINDNIAGGSVVLAKSECTVKNGRVKCSFDIDFNNDEITKNLYHSYRDVFIEYYSADGKSVKNFIYSSKYFNIKCSFETLNLDFYRYMEGYAKLKCELLWREEENTAQKRKALTFENYPKYRQEKIDPKRIVFESMWGSKYSCNPQHLYEYIDKNYPGFECIWSLKDPRMPVKGNAIRVRRGSQEYYRYLATAKYFVNNVNFEDAYVKRDGQIEIQTMHGTPLKTLGLDVTADFPTENARIKYIEKNDRWNYLLVQGKFMEDKAEGCFKYNKDMLRCGYPRTDILFDGNQQKTDAKKRELNLPLDKKIILYTPTWRIRNKFEMKLDLEKMREKLSDEYIILVRLHHFCASGYDIPADNEFIFNFNSYRYVEELYMISDILITDYSSVMFDYALLKKPMLFFTYDLEEYSEKLRGLYVDIVKEAPGPLLYDTDQVINAILNIDEEMEKCSERIKAFHEKFLTYENADSCKQIVKQVFKPTFLDKFKRKHK